MNILVFNCGSSSQNFRVCQVGNSVPPVVIASGKARNVATKTQESPRIDWSINGQAGSRTADLSTHRQAAQEILSIMSRNHIPVHALGHRFVHGGELFQETTRIDHQTMAELKRCLPLAPIHNPNSYSVIEVCQEALPGVPQFAVFDTAFHAHLPEAARRYAIPQELSSRFGFRKYGFHGLSYQYISAKAAELLGKPFASVKLIMCHLGTGGASVAAFRDGHTIETSMGYSPLAGLVMSTRCGDIDAEVVLELVREGYSAEEISSILNNQSGLLGLSGLSSNLAEVISEAVNGNHECRIAFEVYANRLQLYLGAYYWMLNGADAIVFTDEIGTHSSQLREKVCGGVQNLGVQLDLEANRTAAVDATSLVSRDDSVVKILIIPTDEEWVIMQEVLSSLENK